MSNSMFSNSEPCFTILSGWQLMHVSGKDAKPYLQGQITFDLMTQKDTDVAFAAHCDAKGKVFSTLVIFSWQDDLYYLVRKSVTQPQLAELKKYAIFSDVTITPTTYTLLGIQGENAEELLKKLNIKIPAHDHALQEANGIFIIRFDQPRSRFLLIAPPADKDALCHHLMTLGITSCDEQAWVREEIKAGYPIIDQATFLQFLPQALSLDKIGAISFTKGCYRGQEMVARAQYRGANKRALFCLQGQSTDLPKAGDVLQIALGENWRDSGSILAAVRLPDGQTLLQVVLSQDTTSDDVFRIKHDPNSRLTVHLY